MAQQVHLKAIVMRATENKWCGVQRCTRLSVVFYTGNSVWSVCIVSHVAVCVFFWLMIRAVLSLARCCQLFLHILARRSAIASLSVGAVAKCIVALFVGHALSPHACLSFPVLVVFVRESTTRSESPVLAGRVLVESEFSTQSVVRGGQ